MAKCDEGYFCEVCGKDVENITQSDLYLRYVIGELDPELLHIKAERHIARNPVLAQFIVDDEFSPVTLDDDFGKQNLDSNFVRDRELLVTRGWRRLREVWHEDNSILDYPLDEVIAKLKDS